MRPQAGRLLAHGYQLVNRMSLTGKLFLVFGHYIAPAHAGVIIKVVGLRQKNPACQVYLFQREFEQFTVVRFELHYAVEGENFVIAFEILPEVRRLLACLALGHGSEKFR